MLCQWGFPSRLQPHNEFRFSPSLPLLGVFAPLFQSIVSPSLNHREVVQTRSLTAGIRRLLTRLSGSQSITAITTSMDSMRSLNTSLPGATPTKQQMGEPSEQLLTAFKAAALSVTNLYKSAAADQGRARAEGYQDALDELLAFLDKEDIGLSDGEGWRIRRWATERLDGRDSVSQHVESDDEISEKPERGSSPILQRSQSVTRLSSAGRLARTTSPARTESAPPPTNITPITEEATVNIVPPQGTFTFRSSLSYPQDADVVLSDLEIADNARAQSHDGSITSHASNTGSSGITVTRPSRTRHNNHSARINSRNTTSIGRGAGQKRKINFGEFFDIGNLGKDGFGGGGKRGRFA